MLFSNMTNVELGIHNVKETKKNKGYLNIDKILPHLIVQFSMPLSD